MQITSIDVIRLKGRGAVKESAPFTPTVIRIGTAEGVTGCGEIGLAYGIAKYAQFGMAKDFAGLILGMDPMNSEQIWEKIFRKTFWGMSGGAIIYGALSAIDIALWDIKGKVLNAPVYQLLGGKTNTKLRAYASQIQFDWGKVSTPLSQPEQYAVAAKKAVDDGYDCVKVDPVGFDQNGVWNEWNTYGILKQDQLKLAVDRIAAIREAVGPNVDIIIELHALTDSNTAVQLGRELEPYKCFYYEEPVMPLNAESMRQIADKVRIPIASGERIFGRWGYRPFFEDRSLHVIQPDLGNCGGLTEGKKICDMANVYDCAVQMHVCGGPFATAAALQLEAVIPNFLIHEHHAAALLDENIALCEYDYQPTSGYFEVPDLPGIGQELSKEALKNAYIETVK